MNAFFEGLGLQPFWGSILIILFITSIAGIIFLILDSRFRKKLKNAIASPEKMEEFRNSWPPEKLVWRSRRMEKLAEVWGGSIVQETGLAPLWTKRLKANPRIRYAKRVLKFCPEQDSFTVFIASQLNSRIEPVFLKWIEETGEARGFRILATSCRGELFDGKTALSQIGNHIESLRELTGDQEWYSRYFAYQIILHDQDQKSKRASWDGFMDSHPLIRKTLAEGFHTDKKEKLYKQLWELVIEDPVYEVRRTAKTRILNDFRELYTPATGKLTGIPALRVLQLLEKDTPEDSNIAMKFLQDSDLELRYPAAIFLESAGVLDNLLLNASLDDGDELDRNWKLLQKAMEVNVSSFLNRIDSSSSPGALLVAARLLKKKGNRRILTPTAASIFNFFKSRELTPGLKDIYLTLLEGIEKRGDDSSLLKLKDELNCRRENPAFLELLIPRIPSRGDALFLPLLLDFLKTDSFPSRDILLKTLKKFSPELLLPSLFEILDSSRKIYTHRIRISALHLLNELKLPYCLQSILENLPVLPREEAGKFAAILNAYPGVQFEKKVKALLKTPDSQIRSSIISILPGTENRNFMTEVRAALKDPDPDVRISAIITLLEFGEIQLLNQETSMLRDPVQRVRIETARVIGKHGIPAALTVLEEILSDKNEVYPVKSAAIAGLGASDTPRSLKILTDLLDSNDRMNRDLIAALTNRTSNKDLDQLVKIFIEAPPSLREKLIIVFKAQEKNTEPVILNLLTPKLSPLKPYISKILDSTGFTEKTIRKLSNRNSALRLQAAEVLSRLESKSAYRGLVLAARDPDQEIRVLVVKALEKLTTPEGAEILESLKEDPNRRIRKYTLWAMERIRALALD